MPKKLILILALLVIVIVAGGLFAVTWDIPPPTTQVEKTIPDERFPR
jgi:hypothetical protein